jgi:hypothetical protein
MTFFELLSANISPTLSDPDIVTGLIGREISIVPI